MKDKVIRNQLIGSLKGERAHISFDQAIAEFPFDLAGQQVINLEHTAWQLVYHLWFCQWDILDFMINPEYKYHEFPSGYWPKQPGPASEKIWQQTINNFRQDQRTVISMIKDPEIELSDTLPYDRKKTYFREYLILIDHNSYHIGQLVDIRMLLGVPVRGY